jgi:outer membrane protein assembly factor BamD (BamD/ComL family)
VAPASPALLPPSGVERKTKIRGAEAAELFSEANLLRRQGRMSDACARYRTLLANHPSAREAPPARMALAKLLAGSRPAEALEHYRRVAAQPGPLQAEALWGVVETARRLGQSAAEESALSRLVERYPNSPYAEAARTRGADGRE